uniref:Uncharacterized protein n=1 Tax=Globodera rostochiensis TaxID=31243 RepID=A0A914I221_GLORO
MPSLFNVRRAEPEVHAHFLHRLFAILRHLEFATFDRRFALCAASIEALMTPEANFGTPLEAGTIPSWLYFG